MEESTLQNIDAHIFALKNQIVALKVNNKLSEEEKESKIAELRSSITRKEALYKDLIELCKKRFVNT